MTVAILSATIPLVYSFDLKGNGSTSGIFSCGSELDCVFVLQNTAFSVCISGTCCLSCSASAESSWGVVLLLIKTEQMVKT